MATVTNLETAGTTTNATSYATGTVSPTATVCVIGFFSNAGADPTVSGLGLNGGGAWTKVMSQLTSAGNAEEWIYVGTGTPTSGTVTIDFGAESKTTFHWSLCEIDGADATTPVVQSAGANIGTSSATPNVTLAALASPTNPVLGFTGSAGAQPTFTAGTNFTLLGQSVSGGPNVGHAGEHGVNDTTVDFSMSSSESWTIAAVEIAEAAGGQTIAVGQATETETGGVVTPVKPISVAVGQASETEAAQAIAASKPVVGQIGQATETETAQTVTPDKPITVAVGQAVEAETGQAVTPVKPQTVPVGQATESEAAGTVTPVGANVVAVGQATETETAQAITPIKPQTVTVGTVGETETAQTVTPATAQTVAVGQATEAEAAQTVTPVKALLVQIGTAIENELALVITPVGAGVVIVTVAEGTVVGPTTDGSILGPSATATAEFPTVAGIVETPAVVGQVL